MLIGRFVDTAKDSFMSVMRATSLIAELIGLLGALAAFAFLPTRTGHAEHTAAMRAAPVVDEVAVSG